MHTRHFPLGFSLMMTLDDHGDSLSSIIPSSNIDWISIFNASRLTPDRRNGADATSKWLSVSIRCSALSVGGPDSLKMLLCLRIIPLNRNLSSLLSSLPSSSLNSMSMMNMDTVEFSSGG